ncbi:amino acid ABC transporter permease [Fructobacillus ficulneus]|uniref:ABC transporter, permease protein n=1 Tax=Fructobacillus ficulneus TaxID=157463 RepID=A0A0K8MGB2_9LACO|nr:amino acid ABC transporter permease [Fructobacillus ficulneus]GAO99238.1 ABC transporter, permease protein [Fructobacillus ficulneus]
MDINFMSQSFPKLLSVLPITLYLSFLGIAFGLILAIVITIIREKHIPFLTTFFNFYVSFFRGIPIIVQIYIVYYGLPRLLYSLTQHGAHAKAITLSGFLIGIIAFALNASANLSEAIKSAYHSVDSTQYEAAIATGLSPFTTIKRVIIPQLLPNLIPNFSNIFLDLLKDTALVYNIGIVEIMGKANILASFGFNYLEAYLDALVIYLVVCYLFSNLFRFIEKDVRKKVFS